MATEDRWHDFAKEKPSEDMEGRNFIVSNGYSDTLSMWCGGYWENEPFMGNKLCDEVVRWKGYLTPEEEKANETTSTELYSYYYYEDIVLTPATHRYRVYHADEVDELLAKKDAFIKTLGEGQADLAREIERLKQKLEDVQASAYAEMVDAGMSERKLKRALWLARAERANEHYHRYHGKFLCPLEDIPEYVKWKQVERKCLKKVEELK